MCAHCCWVVIAYKKLGEMYSGEEGRDSYLFVPIPTWHGIHYRFIYIFCIFSGLFPHNIPSWFTPPWSFIHVILLHTHKITAELESPQDHCRWSPEGSVRCLWFYLSSERVSLKMCSWNTVSWGHLEWSFSVGPHPQLVLLGSFCLSSVFRYCFLFPPNWVCWIFTQLTLEQCRG